MPKKKQEYGNDSITSLKGADRVRKRPAVIFGSDGLEGCEHSFFEILSNSIDEAREGYGSLMQLKNSWATFTQNHPKFPKFLQAASTAVKEDTLIEIKITTAEGKVIETNLKVKASDIELFKNLTM